MTVHYEGHGVTLHHGDCRDVLATIPDASVHAVVCDPPYELGFMGKGWDASGIAYDVNVWREVFRVLKPGGHLLAFGGTRTWHRLACAVEDAGFEIRDSIAWLYGSGFPKSLDVSKAIDKAAGAEREVVGPGINAAAKARHAAKHGPRSDMAALPSAPDAPFVTAPATDAAREWEGWGTALKPAHEPVVVARKPLGAGTVAANVQAHGTGALNIGACRIGTEGGRTVHTRSAGSDRGQWAGNEWTGEVTLNGGRWPANVILDDDTAAHLDEQSGNLTSGGLNRGGGKGRTGIYGEFGDDLEPMRGHTDKGGASRFFYVAKAPKRERPVVDGVAHPTVKPLTLMRHLVRLVTPPGGTVLEPFAGSGTTVEACLAEGFQCIAIEKGDEYLPLIRERIRRATELPEVDELTRVVDQAAAIAEQVAGQLDIFGEETA